MYILFVFIVMKPEIVFYVAASSAPSEVSPSSVPRINQQFKKLTPYYRYNHIISNTLPFSD